MANNPKLETPFSISIGELTFLEERLGTIEIKESNIYPFIIIITIIPSEQVELDSSLLNLPVTISFSKDTVNTDLVSFPRPSKSEYKGYVAKETRKFIIGNDLGGIELIIYHPLYLLSKGTHARIFAADPDNLDQVNNKLEDILETVLLPYRSIFSSFGVKSVSCKELPQINIPYLCQYEEDDLHFLLRLCETYGIHFLQDGETLFFQSNQAELPEAYTIPVQTEALYNFISSDESCVLESRDMDYFYPYSNLPGDVPTASYTVAQGGAYEKYVQYHYSIKEEGLAYLTNLGKQIEYHQQTIHIQNDFHFDKHSVNRPLVGVRSGDVVNILGIQNDILIHYVSWKYQGTETIGSYGIIENEVENYKIDIFGRESSIPYIPENKHKKKKIHGWHKAIVIAPASKAIADPNALGRIKVRFLWDKDPEIHLPDMPEYSCWVRLVMPFAGEQYGIYVMPEIGDEVIISYEDGDIDRPICFGSVYNIESSFLMNNLTNLQEDSSVAQMETIKLKTPKNLVLEFWESEDEENKQRILLSANQKITLIMNVNEEAISYDLDSKGTVSVHASGELTEDSDTQVLLKRGEVGSITITEEGQLNIQAVKEITAVSEEQVAIKSGEGSMTIMSDGTINIEGKAISINGESITINGESVDIQSEKNTTITASGDAEINAVQIKLNC